MDDSRLKRTSLGYFEVAEKPSQEELDTYYAEIYYQQGLGYYDKSYDEDELKYIKLKIKQLSYIVNNLMKITKGKLLDVGCGEGFTLKHYAELGWSVKGIDFSKVGLEQQNPSMLNYVDIGDIYEILSCYKNNNDKYDVIWLNNVLEHVLNPVNLLHDLKKLLYNDGVLVVTVPNDFSDLHEYCFNNNLIRNRFWIALPDHISYFSYNSLCVIANESGWSCEDVISDFPIDLYLFHPGSNYVNDKSLGHAAHRARIQIELLLFDRNIEDVNDYYRSMAKVGFGRNLTAFLQPNTKSAK